MSTSRAAEARETMGSHPDTHDRRSSSRAIGAFIDEAHEEHHRGLRVAVTGGTSGLGLALVREFRRRGARVAFVARTRSSVEEVATRLGALGITADVANKEDIHRIALQVLGG